MAGPPPTGVRIDDGFSTTIEFDSGAVQFWEKSVTPPGIVGGGSVDTTTMRNSEWRTMNAKRLKTLSEMSMTAAYDPAVYDSILAIVQLNQLCTVWFPDGSKIEFWGFLDEFKPNELSEGEQPTADITVIPSNQDDTGAEVEPVYTAAP